MAVKDLLKNMFNKDRKERKKHELGFAKSKHDEVVALCVDAKPLCEDIKNICEDLVKKHLEELGKNKAQIDSSEEYKNFPENGLEHFDASEDEIKDFVKKFIDVSIPDEELKTRLKNQIEGFRILDNPKGKNVRGSVGPKKENDKVVGVEKEVYLGKRQPDGKIKTSLYEIQTYIHEIFHAVSSKHDIVKNERGELNLQGQKCLEIGEIESIFSEHLFIHILKTQPDKFKTDGKFPFGISDDALKKDMTILTYQNIKGFLHNAEIVSDVKGFEMDRKKEDMYRYVVGMVGSNVLMEEYLKNPENASKLLKKYLKDDHELSNDSAMQILSGGKVGTYGHAMTKLKERFLEMRKSKVNAVPPEELSGAKQAIEEENHQQIDYLPESAKSKNKELTTNNSQENDVQIEK